MEVGTAAAEADAIPVRDWTALAMIQALRAAEANLPSLPFPLPAGGSVLAEHVAVPTGTQPTNLACAIAVALVLGVDPAMGRLFRQNVDL